MSTHPTKWLSALDAMQHLQRRNSGLGILAERIIEAAIRSPKVRKRGWFGTLLRDVHERDTPADARVEVYSGMIRDRHGNRLCSDIEIEQHDLDTYATEFHGFPPADSQAESREARLPTDATDAQISQAVTAAYDEAERQNERPPNINELPRHVQAILGARSLKASHRRIRAIAEKPPHTRRRRKSGKTVASERVADF